MFINMYCFLHTPRMDKWGENEGLFLGVFSVAS